jgi:hypothetical protein
VPSMTLLVQRRAADPADAVIVREQRDGHALVGAPARPERLQIRASAPA